MCINIGLARAEDIRHIRGNSSQAYRGETWIERHINETKHLREGCQIQDLQDKEFLFGFIRFFGFISFSSFFLHFFVTDSEQEAI